jgi:hypothetical protein
LVPDRDEHASGHFLRQFANYFPVHPDSFGKSDQLR